MITGVDYLLNLPSLSPDVLITSARGIHGPQMSEIAILFMLALNRDFQDNILNQERKVWKRWPGKLLWKKKAGILGVGIIGREVARKCKAFGMTVYGITSRKREIESVDYSFGPEGLHDVLSEVDYFINVIPSTDQTKGMIGENEFNRMKSTAIFLYSITFCLSKTLREWLRFGPALFYSR